MGRRAGERRLRQIIGPSGTIELELRLLARAEGYVMYRVKGGAACAMREADWLELPLAPMPSAPTAEQCAGAM